jgi:hypothetical protein
MSRSGRSQAAGVRRTQIRREEGWVWGWQYFCAARMGPKAGGVRTFKDRGTEGVRIRLTGFFPFVL